MADECEGERQRANAADERVQELEEFIPEAAPSEVPKLKKQLEQLRIQARNAHGALSKCIEDHHPHTPPPPPPASLRCERTVPGAVTGVATTTLPRQRAIAVDQQRGAIVVFDSDTAELVRNRSFDGAVLGPPLLAPNDDFVVLAGGDKVLRVLDRNGDDKWRTEHPAAIVGAAVSPRTGEVIVTGTGFGDKQVRAFDADLGNDDPQAHRPLWERPMTSSITLVAIGGDDRFVAVACKDHSVHLLDAADGDTVKVFEHDARVEQIAFSPTGKLLAVADADGTVQLIDPASRSEIGLIGHPAPLVALIFDAAGALLATATDEPDGIVRVWRPTAGESEKVFTFTPAPPATITAIGFSPTESRLAIATGATDPVIIDLQTRTLDRKVSSGIASTLAYGPDGLLLIVGAGSTAKVYNTR
jgi:WD40 repeat protein